MGYMTNEQSWSLIKKQYKDLFDIPEYVIDLVAVELILKLCCTGLSKSTIADTLDLDSEYISSTILKYLDFIGWAENLDINPLSVYNDSVSKKIFFESFKIMEKSEIISRFSWRICSRYTKIKERIERYYGNS